MEKWIFDSPDQAGEAFRQFVKQFYQANGFVNGGIVIGDREVHLGLVEMPVLNIYAEQDHLVPPAASKRLRSEEHTSELQSLMRISYAVFCLKKKKQHNKNKDTR